MVVLPRRVMIPPTVVGMHRRTEVDWVRSTRSCPIKSCQLDCDVRCGWCDLVSAWITVVFTVTLESRVWGVLAGRQKATCGFPEIWVAGCCVSYTRRKKLKMC
jgi:hypothetical protein